MTDERLTEEELRQLIEQDDGGVYADTTWRDHVATSGLDTYVEGEDEL